LRTRFEIGLGMLSLLAVSRLVPAQDYLLPNGPGKAELVGACESCHGVMTIVHAGRRSPRQWNDILQQMIRLGLSIGAGQQESIYSYLTSHFGQAADSIPPVEVRALGPGVTLALKAAEAAEKACQADGRQVTTLVVDSADAPVVLLTGDGLSPITQAVAASKVATVLKFKQPSRLVMKQVRSDPTLVSETENDPEIGKVLAGGLPIIVNGDELIGAIAVAGALGRADGDEMCAEAGLERIASQLRHWPVGPTHP
jgi:uncharacterized protein GlcG (DUF336 family)